jgi:Na+-transporting methylmalonyl-CoA/oxaloacetate decarboxylase gamma subunit
METVDWGYVVTTLVIRYAAIFIVLSLLIVLLTINGAVVSRLANRKKKEKRPEQGSLKTEKGADPQKGDPKIPAAIGMAIGLYNMSHDGASELNEDAETHAEWKMAGRVAQWRQKPGRG